MRPHTSRVAVLCAPLLAGYIGLAYLLGDPRRTLSSSFDAAKSLAPMHVWGIVFLAGAVVLTAALLLNRSSLIAAAFFAGGVVYAWWGSCFALQALTDPSASLVGWALYAVLSMLHFVVSARFWKGTPDEF